ncbi:hypothetical protein AN478_02760 [Thiohalorhabdus denitrificans]|uniref:Uncharacterized protein n=1 Tax=Thiohalorhabdus denitrificans TaxID=381306 RepID=A0A0P9CQG4_9GAMM|nr:hypothetical protein [Thiohalorhabdus denitrificans]KPV41505.1 hypothetical protein AN478_02760 [Thiohalorhabdus denitrificans]SCY29745.1 hypothetical protein SAMN05661077_1752 [Thiohalorhabdus denitrificans]
MGSPWIWLVSVAFAALLARGAARRGGNPVLWGGLGFFFGPLPLPFLLLVPVRRPGRAYSADSSGGSGKTSR